MIVPLSRPPHDLERYVTTGEILRQPRIWRAFAQEAEKVVEETREWLARRTYNEVWFCGAGSSAFIGETLATHLNRAVGPARFRSIPTTDLVSSPQNYFRPGLKLLVVSFGRSGDSSESIGVLDLLDVHAPEADRLNITCNASGALAKRPQPAPGESRVIVLPRKTNDQGFAMTSSYTTMLLTALLTFDLRPPLSVRAMFEALADFGEATLDSAYRAFATTESPERAVFLGSGPLTGGARESALKVLELTAGRIETSWNSPLGFRHGPKAIVDAHTKVFVFHSSDPHTRLYDRDLSDELVTQFGERTVIRLGDASVAPALEIPAFADDAYRCVLFVLVAQVLSTIWSERLGLNVDNPFATGNLTRVVAGVKLYPWPPEGNGFTGAVDLGGTKIEACLFDSDLKPIKRRRTPTPTVSYDALLDAVVDAARWLEAEAGSEIRIGVGVPGLIDPVSGVSTTSNLPATGHTLSADLGSRLDKPIVVENDCKLFALSEAALGAGAGFSTVFGLILGTGVGGGVCYDGRLARNLNGLAGEVGHIGVPAALFEKYRLPLVTCGCGRKGCFETLVSGPGLTRLGESLVGRVSNSEEIAAGEGEFGSVRDTWLDLVGELLFIVQLNIDPDCIVIGGGLSNVSGLPERLAEALKRRTLPGLKTPQLRRALFGDASGVRGAAMLARIGVEGAQ